MVRSTEQYSAACRWAIEHQQGTGADVQTGGGKRGVCEESGQGRSRTGSSGAQIQGVYSYPSTFPYLELRVY